MDPKRKNRYQGGNIDELAKPKLIKRESKGSIKKENIYKSSKSSNYKINKKIIPNNISINNKQNKPTGYKFFETQYSSKRKNNINDYKIVKNKGTINNSNNGSNNNSYHSNKNDKYSNSNRKQRSKNQLFEEKVDNKNNVKLKRFNNIDEAVISIQRCFRKYLNKIHNTNSELMKLIQERKKNILQNYNILDNQPIFGTNDNNINNNNENYNKSNNFYNDLAEQFNNNKRKQLKEEVIEDYNNLNNNNNNYEEDNNLYNNNENNEDKNILENDILLNNNFNKKKININLDDIDNNKNEQNIGFGGYSVFEKIYKNMKKNAEMNNINKENEQKYNFDDEFIENKDNAIDNQLDIIKNIQQKQMENLMDKTDKIQNNSNYGDINKKEYKENNNLKEEDIDENNNKIKNEEINNMENNENKDDNNTKNENLNLDDKNKDDNINDNKEGNETKENDKTSKNEVFQRLANYLDSTLQNPENLMLSKNNKADKNNKDITIKFNNK